MMTPDDIEKAHALITKRNSLSSVRGQGMEKWLEYGPFSLIRALTFQDKVNSAYSHSCFKIVDFTIVECHEIIEMMRRRNARELIEIEHKLAALGVKI